MQNPYFGRLAILTTMHGKGAVIAPALESLVGLTVQINVESDTDALGTFSGEVSRKKDMLETAIDKARLGMAVSSCALGIASEGSFGPHPVVPFMAINRELLVFVDDVSGIVIQEMVTSEKTNFTSQVFRPGDDISDFLKRAFLPTHAVVVSPNQSEDKRPMFKGVREETALRSFINQCAEASSDGAALLQTDMRANFNPSRMKVIERCAKKLGERIATICPRCDTPGWGTVDVVRGLPCEYCGTLSNLIQFEVFGCVLCNHRSQRARADGQKTAEQMFCACCNP